ncbi:unnamed protein product [Porites lobata]|uniref:WSC domain-containing protein n=1 Tax=Porites lobata TaxID=104759 RepID=A0ABN8MUH5_9CNID|nr:unnamed protein product [Porites lobata]
MTSGQALLVKLAKLVKELLQKLPYWWKLPIVLMMFYQFRQRDYLLNNNLFDAYSSQLTGPKYDCQDPLIGHMSLGCFKVKYLTPSYEKEDTTIEECVQHCKDKEYAYAGFDHSRQCYCVANLHTCELSQRKCRKRANEKGLPRNMIEVFRTMHCTENMRKFRTHDGTCNDLNQPASGSRFYRFGRNVNRTKTFEDTDLLEPCPRQLSRKLMARDEFIPAKQLNLLAAGWIQFNLHDWFDHGPVDVSRRIRIELNEDDPVYNEHKGEMKIPRTKPDSCQMYSDTDSPATFQNDVTHWWDGSQLYGTDIRTNKKLRSFRKGKMKVGKDGWLPVNRKTGIDITGFSNNWWIGLSLMHNIFTREHNAICDMLLKFHPDWSDQQLYDIARLINTATIQKIHTVEWTPAILNNSALRAGVYVNFGVSPGKEVFDWLAAHNISIGASGAVLKPLVGSPSKFYGVPFSLTEEFVSVYRMHPLLPDDLYMRSVETGQRTGKSYSLSEYSFKGARDIVKKHSVDDVVYTFGVEHPGALTLHNYPKALMNLKLPRHQQNGETIDLATIDILRDRERGIPRYNEVRRLTNLPPVESFEKLTPNMKHSSLLKELYDDDIEKLDLLIGCLAEEPRPDGYGFGETAFNIFVLMASRRLQTDRFMTDDFTSDIYTKEGLEWIQNANMSNVLIRAFPEIKGLEEMLQNVENAFFPWPV